jgi:hypothetical protein
METAAVPAARRGGRVDPSRARGAAARPKRVRFDGTYYFRYDAEGNRTAKYRSATGALDATATDVTTLRHVHQSAGHQGHLRLRADRPRVGTATAGHSASGHARPQ